MRLKFALTGLSLLLVSITWGQLSIDHDSFKVNNLGQIQVLSSKGIAQYSKEGKLLNQFSEDLLGQVTSLDRSSSLESLIFYSDIPGFQILDNTLSPHSSLYDLNLAGFQNVTTACMSNDNTFWAYDAVSFELIRFNDKYEIIERSGNLAVIIGEELSPLSMVLSGNRVFLADSEKGVFVFDLFANFLLQIPFGKMTDMTVTEKWIYMTDGKTIERVDWKGIVSQKTSSISSYAKCIDVESGNLYIGDGSVITRRALNSLFE